MLLTISTTHRPATDLGFLLHKHPDRVQTFSLPFGAAHVFYPEAGEDRCTAALLLDIDPVGLVRRGRAHGNFALAEHVNDRPYVASSFMSVAMVTVFKSAMAGTCKGHEELASAPIALEAWLPVLPADLHPLSVAGFLTTPQPDLRIGGRPVSPLEWLRSGGDVDPVLSVAEAADWASR